MPGTLTAAARLWLPGWHSWPAAPPGRSYLKALHRHTFVITAEVELHADHAVEFHDLQDLIAGWWAKTQPMDDRGSCESMTAALADHLAGRGLVPVETSVGEDGEAWARWRRG
jgi:hypothetical protein